MVDGLRWTLKRIIVQTSIKLHPQKISGTGGSYVRNSMLQRIAVPNCLSQLVLPSNQFAAFLMGSQAFYPFMIQRVYSARDMKSIKAAGWAVLTGPWLVMFAAIFASKQALAEFYLHS